MMKGYEQKKYPVATKRYVQWLELESDEEAIREYRRLHSEGVQWKMANCKHMFGSIS